MIESIEKLRELLKGCGCSDKCYSCGINFHGSIADEIEAEIAERYMLLPLDRKGEPWRIGDKFAFAGASCDKHICTVSGIGDGEVFFYYDEHSDSTKHRHFRAAALVHHKPRTIEDVLRDVWKEALDYSKSDVWRSPDEVFAERADEIREMVEVDA